MASTTPTMRSMCAGVSRPPGAHSVELGLDVTNYQSMDRGMAIRQAEYDYILAAREDDALLIGTWLTMVDGRLNMTRKFQVFRAGDEALILRASWQMVCIELSSGKPKRMPQTFKDIYCPAVVEDTPDPQGG